MIVRVCVSERQTEPDRERTDMVTVFSKTASPNNWLVIQSRDSGKCLICIKEETSEL